MHNPESVLQNDTHNILWDFEIQTDHQILAWRPGLELINMKKELAVDFAIPAEHRVKIRQWKDKQIPIFYKRAEKAVKRDTIHSCGLQCDPHRPGK